MEIIKIIENYWNRKQKLENFIILNHKEKKKKKAEKLKNVSNMEDRYPPLL